MAPEKTDCPVVLYTRHHRIEGTLVLLKGEHLSDKLNISERKFESVQSARVFALEGNTLVHEAPSMAVNKDHIILMLPAGQ